MASLNTSLQAKRCEFFFHEIGIFKNNFNQLQYKKNIFLQEMSGGKNLRTGLSRL